MKNLKIFTQIFISNAAIAFFLVVTISIIFYDVLRDALIQRTIDQLSSINILKKNQIENHFSAVQKNFELIVKSKEFTRANHALAHLEVSGQQTLIANFGNELKNIASLYGFDNITIIDNDHKKLFYTNSDTLRSYFIKRIAFKENKKFQILEATTEKEIALLYVIPIVFEDTVQSGYVIIKESAAKIQPILQETTGMGQSGESYLVGNDFRMRSQSRFIPKTFPLSLKVETEAVKNSFSGASENHILNDYRGVKVLSFYRVVNGVEWAIITEIDFEEAMLPILALRNYLVIIILILILIIIIVTLFISNAISKPILDLKRTIISLSKGIIPSQRPILSNNDEISQMVLAVNQLTEGMQRTTTFANEIGSGNFHASFSTLGPDDTLGKALVNMRDQLIRLNEIAVQRVRDKAAAVLEGQEIERKRIIQDLHDGVGQLLTAVSMRVEILEVESELKHDIKYQINEIIAEVKRISYNVMPQALVDYGLEAALKGLRENVLKYSSFTIDFRYIKEIDRKLNFERSIAIFRIVQEGLNNIIKHANATHVNLHVLHKEDEVYLLLEDNGKGFIYTESSISNGYGLQSMKDRATLLNGITQIYTMPDQGTVIEVHIPIKSN